MQFPNTIGLCYKMRNLLLVVAALLSAGDLLGQLSDYPNYPKPNDSLQILAYKTALSTSGGMPVPAHDAEVYSYSGSNLISVTYKRGGVNGKTVGIMTLSYDGSNVVSRALTIQ